MGRDFFKKLGKEAERIGRQVKKEFEKPGGIEEIAKKVGEEIKRDIKKSPRI